MRVSRNQIVLALVCVCLPLLLSGCFGNTSFPDPDYEGKVPTKEGARPHLEQIVTKDFCNTIASKGDVKTYLQTETDKIYDTVTNEMQMNFVAEKERLVAKCSWHVPNIDMCDANTPEARYKRGECSYIPLSVAFDCEPEELWQMNAEERATLEGTRNNFSVGQGGHINLENGTALFAYKDCLIDINLMLESSYLELGVHQYSDEETQHIQDSLTTLANTIIEHL